MTQQLDMLSRAHDPATSKAAAAAQTPAKRTALQERILRAFHVMGPMHDKQLYPVVQQMEKNLGLKVSSESGIRSRRSELSKPNMDRLVELLRELHGETPGLPLSDAGRIAVARARLRAEGFRSPLWDSGRTEVVDGHRMTVWELAR